MKAIIYLRVSTDEQATSGLGLEAQRAACLSKVPAGSGVSVFADEGVSGSTPIAERNGLPAALEALGKGDMLVIAKRDRLARDYMLAGWVDLEVARRGARLVSAAGEGTDSDDPMSRVMRVIVDAFAQYERDMIRARTKAALAAKRARGEKTGGAIPFGHRVLATEIDADGSCRKILVLDEGEQLAIRRMADLRAQGLGYRAIAEQVGQEGIRGRGCSRIAHTTVRRILESLERDAAPAVGALEVPHG